METRTFDAVTRRLGGGATRRAALGGLIASALGLGIGGATLDADAKRRKRRKKKRKAGGGQNQGLLNGARCETSAQCGDANNICEVAVNAGNSDRTCCGGQGATCGPPNGDGDDTAPFCCVGHRCTGGVCQLVPDV